MRSALIFLILLISGILSAAAGHVHCRENVAGAAVAVISDVQPVQDKVVGSFLQAGINDQLDDDGMDDDTIDHLLKNSAAASLLLSFIISAGLKAAATAAYSPFPFLLSASRILFIRSIRI